LSLSVPHESFFFFFCSDLVFFCVSFACVACAYPRYLGMAYESMAFDFVGVVLVVVCTIVVWKCELMFLFEVWSKKRDRV
jgi:hypothetical protein